jgi:hypothetical protein
MANICPKSDGSNMICDLSAENISSIFKIYPSVKQKFAQNVPHKMKDEEFWTKFFQSYYYRRDQIHSLSNDIFSDCALKDDAGIFNENKTLLSLFNQVLLTLLK